MVCDTCRESMNTDARFCCHCGQPLAQSAWNSFRNSFNGRLMRAREGCMLGGVCAGIAAAYGLDPVLVRVATAVLFFCGFGTVALVYVALWVIMPREPLMAVPMPPPASSGFAGAPL